MHFTRNSVQALSRMNKMAIKRVVWIAHTKDSNPSIINKKQNIFLVKRKPELHIEEYYSSFNELRY